MADKADEIMVSWVKLRGSNCPAYPVRTTVGELSVFLAQLEPGDGLLVIRPLPGEGGERLRRAGDAQRSRLRDFDTKGAVGFVRGSQSVRNGLRTVQKLFSFFPILRGRVVMRARIGTF